MRQNIETSSKLCANDQFDGRIHSGHQKSRGASSEEYSVLSASKYYVILKLLTCHRLWCQLTIKGANIQEYSLTTASK
jgi:hypothetical protein